MAPLDELISADAVNVPTARHILQEFDPDLVPVLELASELFDQLFAYSASGFGERDAADDDELERLRLTLRLDMAQMLELVRGDAPVATADAPRTVWRRMQARKAQVFVLLLLYRYFRWGVTDLLRLRVTPVTGYARLQAEACALIRLFASAPEYAQQWLGIRSDGDGTRFYRASQTELRRIMEAEGLAPFYERGSGGFQHVRLMSAVPGLTLTEIGTQLRDQEIDPTDLGSYIRHCLWFASAQVPIFASLSRVLPNASGLWNDRQLEFGRRWAALWRKMEQRYPISDSL